MADPARRRKVPAKKDEPTPDNEASKARALAPVYDYIRQLVARWEAEDRSRGEDKSA